MDSFSQLCSDFTKLSPVEVIALGGSRSGTNHDHSSDYDLYIYCSSIPPIEDRQNIIERHFRYFEINNQYWETEDDCTLNDGIDIDILYRSMKDFENGVAIVVEKFIAGNGYTTCFWHNLMPSKILFDPQNKLKKLQERFDVPYPEMLKKNIISRNFNLLTGKLPSYDRQIIKAVTRQDFVSVNHRVSAFLESYFDIIFALNELTHPGEKRMISYAKEQANILPKDFETNILKLCSINSQNREIAVEDCLNGIISNLREVIDKNIR